LRKLTAVVVFEFLYRPPVPPPLSSRIIGDHLSAQHATVLTATRPSAAVPFGSMAQSVTLLRELCANAPLDAPNIATSLDMLARRASTARAMLDRVNPAIFIELNRTIADMRTALDDFASDPDFARSLLLGAIDLGPPPPLPPPSSSIPPAVPPPSTPPPAVLPAQPAPLLQHQPSTQPPPQAETLGASRPMASALSTRLPMCTQSFSSSPLDRSSLAVLFSMCMCVCCAELTLVNSHRSATPDSAAATGGRMCGNAHTH
jgi:hypothetical protein